VIIYDANDVSGASKMTDSALSHTPKIRVECPFEDRSILDAYWSRPGTFKLQLLKKAEQLQQIFQHFADAQSRQSQGENAKVSY
jgi:hypothetical protein